MKKLIVFLCAAVVAASAIADDVHGKATADGIGNVLSLLPGTCEQVTTNAVYCYEVTKITYEPCACPDGIPGCLAMHMRKVEKREYIRVDIEDRMEVDGHSYVPVIVKGSIMWMHAAACRCLAELHRKEKARRGKGSGHGRSANP